MIENSVHIDKTNQKGRVSHFCNMMFVNNHEQSQMLPVFDLENKNSA